ncbi:hypothetical protein R3P38DRAFT_2816381 [Favolaschia claudopus]|uniref:RNI-like protein n=1 Tax=Favolaschia claudopus TaxID=2862362 RepID=A0AAV9YZ53_9AGAR
MRLFSKISLTDHEGHTRTWDEVPTVGRIASVQPLRNLYAILQNSTHLSTYITTVNLFFRTDEEENLVLGILSSTTSLDTLILGGYLLRPFPINATTLSIFSHPTLRCVDLRNSQFTDENALELLLSHAIGLKELILRNLYIFNDLDADGDANAQETVRHSGRNRIRLESLTLAGFAEPERILQTFSTVDIKHLLSLSIFDGPSTAFIRANAASLQRLSVGQAHGGIGESVQQFFVNLHTQPMFNKATAAYSSRLTQCLLSNQYLDLEANDICGFVSFIGCLGHLDNLSALKTVRVIFHQALDQGYVVANDDDYWASVDEDLHELRSDVVVQIHGARATDCDCEPEDRLTVDMVKSALRLTSNRRDFHVYLDQMPDQ